MKLLQEVYPNYNWNNDKLLYKYKRSSQWYLCKILQSIFPPGIDVLEEYQFQELNFNTTGYTMTFDIYIPALKIIFEYHGFQHYYDHFMFGDVKSLKGRDRERTAICAYHDISYLEVPYWWQNDKESIIAIVYKIRPDIVPNPVVTPFHYPVKPFYNQI